MSDDKTVTNNIAMTQAFIVQLCNAGMAVSTAIHEGYKYLCELLYSQGNRDPLSRKALAATLLGKVAYEAGVHPNQQRAYARHVMEAYGSTQSVQGTAPNTPYLQLYKKESEEERND